MWEAVPFFGAYISCPSQEHPRREQKKNRRMMSGWLRNGNGRERERGRERQRVSEGDSKIVRDRVREKARKRETRGRKPHLWSKRTEMPDLKTVGGNRKDTD